MFALKPQRHPTIETNSTLDPREAERQRLRTSPFQLVSSFFMATIILVGTMVVTLFLVWLTTRWDFPPRALESVVKNASGTLNPDGVERDFEPPGVEEVEDLIEPTLPETLQALDQTVSTVAASLVTVETVAAEPAHGKHGDSRPPGTENGEHTDDVIPRHMRWQIEFTARDLASYGKQLDFFGIELGVIGGNIQGVDVVNNLTGGPDHYRVTDTGSEKRLYFLWNRPGPLLRFDQQFLRRAGIQVADRTIVKFIPSQLEHETLAILELEYARSKGFESVSSIAKTVFECRPDGNGYRFEVTNQRYRRASSRSGPSADPTE